MQIQDCSTYTTDNNNNDDNNNNNNNNNLFRVLKSHTVQWTLQGNRCI